METQEVIHSKPVLSRKGLFQRWKSSLPYWAVIFGISLWLCLITGKIILFKSFLFVFFTTLALRLIIDLMDWSYAWTLDKTGIHLTKYNAFKTEVDFFTIDEINEVKWNGGSRQLWFKLYLSSSQTYLILPKESIYTGAGLLRGFHNLGVKVSTTYKDAEIEMFINGKIDSIPINMDEM